MAMMAASFDEVIPALSEGDRELALRMDAMAARLSLTRKEKIVSGVWNCDYLLGEKAQVLTLRVKGSEMSVRGHFNHMSAYPEEVDACTPAMKKTMKSAVKCVKDPAHKCRGGVDFILEGTPLCKCRYQLVFKAIDDAALASLLRMAEREINLMGDDG